MEAENLVNTIINGVKESNFIWGGLCPHPQPPMLGLLLTGNHPYMNRHREVIRL